MKRPGYIMYAYGDNSDDSTTFHIHVAGNTTSSTASNATFSTVRGFVQVSENLLVAADKGNRVLRVIDRKTGATFNFCKNLIYFAMNMIKDNRNKDQLLVVDYWYGGITRVDANTGAVSKLVEDALMRKIRYLTQDEKGDLYTTASHGIFKVTYKDKKVTLISGIPYKPGYKDSTVVDSLYNDPHDITVIGPGTLLVADYRNSQIRIIDLYSDRVSTLGLSGSENYEYPSSLLLPGSTLYIGYSKNILQYKCMYSAI